MLKESQIWPTPASIWKLGGLPPNFGRARHLSALAGQTRSSIGLQLGPQESVNSALDSSHASSMLLPPTWASMSALKSVVAIGQLWSTLGVGRSCLKSLESTLARLRPTSTAFGPSSAISTGSGPKLARNGLRQKMPRSWPPTCFQHSCLAALRACGDLPPTHSPQHRRSVLVQRAPTLGVEAPRTAVHVGEVPRPSDVGRGALGKLLREAGLAFGRSKGVCAPAGALWTRKRQQ